MRIVVGSASSRKIEVTRQTFARYFPGEVHAEGLAIESAVPPTPYGRDTLRGARHRARACRRRRQADYYVGLESGLVRRYGRLFEETWAYVLTPDQRRFVGYSSGLPVPDFILARMRESGREHFQIMEALEAERGWPVGDTWSNYTDGRIRRDVSLDEALRNAVVQIDP
jgi:inosine/xanthosine triphosphatase